MKRFSLLLVLCFAHSVQGQEEFVMLKDSTKLYVEDSGKGQTLLFIPGWTMTGRFFEKQQQQLSKTHQVITYDPRGQGKSNQTIYKNTYFHHAKDLRELILQKDLKDVILIGWSSGCLTLFEYLRTYQNDRIKQLVFIDEPPKWIGEVDKEWVYGTFDNYRSSLKGMLEGPSEPNGIIDWMLKDSIAPETRAWMRNEIQMTPPHVALSLYIDGLACDYTQEVQSISIPTLYMVRDSWFTKARSWLNEKAPKIEVVSISSHAMFWEKPEEFNAQLLQFIQSNQ
ncbi:MAG: alpha/beta hydrolase [Bacteroidota bacterium]